MEQELFDWDYQDDMEDNSYIYYNIILKVPVGKFSIGETFDFAHVDYENMIVSFHKRSLDDTEIVATFRLKLQLKEINN